MGLKMEMIQRVIALDKEVNEIKSDLKRFYP